MSSRPSMSSDQDSLATVRLLRNDPELNEKRDEYEGHPPRLSIFLISTQYTLAGHLIILLTYSMIFVFATKVYLNQKVSSQRASNIYSRSLKAQEYDNHSLTLLLV